VSPKNNALDTVARFQSEVAAIRGEPDPFALRLTLYALTALTIVVVALLFVAKVDRVVSSTSGKVVSTVPAEIFQALDTSIIKSIDVKEGEHVVKGQVLATLDPTFAGADVTQLSLQVASLDAQLARADAEQSGHAPAFIFNNDPDRQRYGALQLGLFNQRAAQLQAQLMSYDQKIDQTLATVHKLEGDESRLQERTKIAEQVEGMRTTLLAKGAGSLLNQLASKDQRIEQMRSLENLQNSLIEAKHQISSLRADREAFVQQWKTDLSKEVVTARNARDTALAQLEKAKKHQDLVRLVANNESVVLTVAKLSVGSVLKEGDPLITVVPLGAPLEAEIRIAARDIGFLRAGDHATLKIDAFDYVEHGTASGVVKWISEGAFNTNDDTNQPIDPYYRARVSIDDMHFIGVPQNFRLIPGMTLSADINVGRRSLGAYVLDGFIKGAGGAMREP
jgi:HlyD family secretion protein